MSAAPAQLAGRKVTVMGLGLFGGGAAVARFAVRRGARVCVTDLRDEQQLGPALAELADLDARFVLGRHDEADFEGADLVVVNPAVPPRSRFLRVAREAGTRLTSEVALFLDHTPARVAAITGTQGKSSTTHYLAQLLAEGLERGRVHLGGNIGHSLLDDLEHMSTDDVCALELSSYQLERLPEDLSRSRASSPIEVAVVTNVLADHLERHGTREAYGRAKLRLLEVLAPGGAALLPADGLPVEARPPTDARLVLHPGPDLGRTASGYELDGERLATRALDERCVAFQRDNAHLALAAARLLGAHPDGLARAAEGLRGLPHRLDLLGELRGRRLWDNAVSTTPDSTLSALRSLPSGVTLMVGGQVKDLDLEPLLRAAREREARVVVFGRARESWPARFDAAGVEVHVAAGPREALELALELGGGDLLFSPACSSFDAYPNFQARADELHAAARDAGLVQPQGAPV